MCQTVPCIPTAKYRLHPGTDPQTRRQQRSNALARTRCILGIHSERLIVKNAITGSRGLQAAPARRDWALARQASRLLCLQTNGIGSACFSGFLKLPRVYLLLLRLSGLDERKLVRDLLAARLSASASGRRAESLPPDALSRSPAGRLG